MSEELDDDRLLTIPEEMKSVKSDNMKQTIVRVHKTEFGKLRVLLKRDKLSFQKFITHCIRAYMDADPYMLKALKNVRELEKYDVTVGNDKGVLSHRERNEIYKALEESQKESK